MFHTTEGLSEQVAHPYPVFRFGLCAFKSLELMAQPLFMVFVHSKYGCSTKMVGWVLQYLAVVSAACRALICVYRWDRASFLGDIVGLCLNQPSKYQMHKQHGRWRECAIDDVPWLSRWTFLEAFTASAGLEPGTFDQVVGQLLEKSKSALTGVNGKDAESGKLILISLLACLRCTNQNTVSYMINSVILEIKSIYSYSLWRQKI